MLAILVFCMPPVLISNDLDSFRDATGSRESFSLSPVWAKIFTIIGIADFVTRFNVCHVHHELAKQEVYIRYV